MNNNSGNNVKTPQKNYESNNNKNYNENDNINRYDNYIPEEEFETEEINDENIKRSAGIQNSKNELNNDNYNNNNNVNESEDIRLNYVMQRLGLESLIEVFENYHMSFNDVLFLSKDDLNELGFKIFQKNRLLSFIEEYTSKAKNYTLEEIQAFFEENSIYNLSGNQE